MSLPDHWIQSGYFGAIIWHAVCHSQSDYDIRVYSGNFDDHNFPSGWMLALKHSARFLWILWLVSQFMWFGWPKDNGFVILGGQLEILEGLRATSEVQGQYQLGAFDDEAKIEKMFKVKKGPENYTFLVWRETEEEVVLDIQGLVAAFTLPPVTDVPSKSIRVAFYSWLHSTVKTVGKISNTKGTPR